MHAARMNDESFNFRRRRLPVVSIHSFVTLVTIAGCTVWRLAGATFLLHAAHTSLQIRVNV